MMTSRENDPLDRRMIENFLLVSGFYQTRSRHATISFKKAGATHFCLAVSVSV